ncbi:MAG TPA: TonB-dependent receptor, partial [Opitutus sp.]|nr:TonB-dependent receptor [Opitutus sp.]
GVFARTIQVALGYAWFLADEEVDTDQTRIEANYRFELGKTEHNLLLGRTDLTRVRRRTSSGTNNLPTQQYNWRAPDDFSHFRYDPANQVPLNKQSDEDLHRNDAGHYLVYQGKYFSDRLNIIGGIRHDRADGKRVYRDLVTGETGSVQGSKSGKPTTKWSPQYGASFALTREITIFGLGSSGLSPNDDKTDGAGYVMRPTTAKSLEAGFKIDLFNGRVSGTISAYHIERNDVPQYFWWAPAPVRPGYDASLPITYRPFWDARNRLYYVDDPVDRGILQGIFDSMNNPNQLAPADNYLYAGADVNQPRSGAYAPVNDESKGADAQIILTLKPNWQVVLGYSHVERKLVQGPELVAAPYSPFSPWFALSNSPVGIWGGGPVG